MFIKQIVLKNLRSIAAADWEISDERAKGWHVVIGDNGAGKSTFLRSVALALAGPREAPALRQDWSRWLRADTTTGRISVFLESEPKWDKFAKGGRLPKVVYLAAGLSLKRAGDAVELVAPTDIEPDPTRHVWGSGDGWFSASYGPFRRFAGGDKEQEKLFYSNPRLARHLSVFGESIALSESIEWLKTLRFRQLESDGEGALLDSLQRFVNQPDFLPHGAQLHAITSKGVRILDGNGFELTVEDLSDGYRSILSMTFELIRQMALTYGAARVFDAEARRVVAPGVVLIDEIDAHLHPTWQRRAGIWFRQHFPEVQFIVTTHSPLVCQSAEHGTVFRLPRPGTDETARMIQGAELDRLLYGDVLDAYGTGLFGEGVTRSEGAHRKLQRLAELNQKDLDPRTKLTAAERKERDVLRSVLPTVAPSVTT